MGRYISLLGLLVMLLIAWLLSNNRRRVSWRLVAMGLVLQLVFALFSLKTDTGRRLFDWTGDVFQSTVNHVAAGSEFVFNVFPQPGDAPLTPPYTLLRSVAFGVLPTIVFFSSLMAILYHLGVMQKIVESLARIMQVTLGTSGAESLSAAANIFVGQTEAPLVIRPYVGSMTMSELNAVMVGGFATIAGGVMAAYVSMGIDAAHLLTASVISAPAALLIAKIMVPETETPKTLGKVRLEVTNKSVNVIEAAAEGAASGMKLAINVAAMLIAFLALLSLLNGILAWCGDHWYRLTDFQGPAWSLELVLGYLFAPLAWLMGVPKEDCFRAGELLGIKTVGNEFIAFANLGEWAASGTPSATETASAATTPPQPRTMLIMTYALAGFANFSSIGIQLGGIGGIAPERRSDLATLGLKAMIGGTLAAFMTACLAGILVTDAALESRPDAPAVSPNKSDTGQAETNRNEAAREKMEAEPEPSEPADTEALNESQSSKRIGNSSAIEVMTRSFESGSTSTICSSLENSARTCRQAPQGVPGPLSATASRVNLREPAETAFPTATRSAQIVSPYEAFSMLHPV